MKTWVSIYLSEVCRRRTTNLRKKVQNRIGFALRTDHLVKQTCILNANYYQGAFLHVY